LIEYVIKWNNDIAEKHQAFAGVGVRYVGKLAGAYPKLLRKNLAVALRLVEQIDEVCVYKVISSRCFAQYSKLIMSR